MADSGDFAFLNGGKMAQAVRAYDWANSPLGAIEAWPASLKTMVGLILASEFPSAIVWGPHLVTIYNDAFRPILGNKPEALGRCFTDVWQEVRDDIQPLIDKAFAGQATFIEDYPLVIDRKGYSEQAYFTFCYSPIRDPDGHVVGMLDTVVETTTKARAEKITNLLNGELAHRARNLLTLVSAMIEQTFRSSQSKDDIHAALNTRITALAQAQEILSRTNWSVAPIRSVIQAALMPHSTGVGRIVIDGPPLDLSPGQALSMALAVNELATNATKYGALANESGRIAIRWRLGAPASNETFAFVWHETSGPPVAAPRRRGFGTRLIERALADDFHGAVKIDYEPAGLRCSLTTTMKNLPFAGPPRK